MISLNSVEETIILPFLMKLSIYSLNHLNVTRISINYEYIPLEYAVSYFPYQVAAVVICSGLQVSQMWLEGTPSICLCPEFPLTLYPTLFCAFLVLPQEKHTSSGFSGLFY